MSSKNIPIVSITGTKGKTTVVGLVASSLAEMGVPTLAVDTRGHHVNGEQMSTHIESQSVWGLLPTRAPGRYLWEFMAGRLSSKNNGVAVLEASVGCAESGLGYKEHDIGVFLNVFEDHVGRPGIANRLNLAQAKKGFILNYIKPSDSFAILNADDDLVMQMARESIDAGMKAEVLPVGRDFRFFDLKKHLSQGGVAVTEDDSGRAILLRRDEVKVLADLKKVSVTVDGQYEPGVTNALFACAILYALGVKGCIGLEDVNYIEAAELPRDSGRMTFLKAKNGAEVIVDYAHEAHSLGAIAKLARGRMGRGGRLVGVIRLAHRRGGNDLLRSAAKVVADSFDEVFVYDKFDYHAHDGESVKAKEAQQAAKYVVSMITEFGGRAIHVQREDDAIRLAFESVKPDDSLVVISNDNTVQSMGYVSGFVQASQGEANV